MNCEQNVTTHVCPKCDRRLRKCGELEIADVEHAVYECNECLISRIVGGELIDIPFTFAVSPTGRVFVARD